MSRLSSYNRVFYIEIGAGVSIGKLAVGLGTGRRFGFEICREAASCGGASAVIRQMLTA